MTRTIYKYTLGTYAALEDTMQIYTHGDATPLSVDKQYGIFVLWAVVNPNAAASPTTILVRGTGHPLTGDEDRFLNTVVDEKLRLVFHFFTANG